jgi:hypothetical protein
MPTRRDPLRDRPHRRPRPGAPPPSGTSPTCVSDHSMKQFTAWTVRQHPGGSSNGPRPPAGLPRRRPRPPRGVHGRPTTASTSGIRATLLSDRAGSPRAPARLDGCVSSSPAAPSTTPDG